MSKSEKVDEVKRVMPRNMAHLTEKHEKSEKDRDDVPLSGQAETVPDVVPVLSVVEVELDIRLVAEAGPKLKSIFKESNVL